MWSRGDGSAAAVGGGGLTEDMLSEFISTKIG